MTRASKVEGGLLIASLFAFACETDCSAIRARSMRDRTGVLKLTESMKPVCDWRFLLDLPAQADVRLSSWKLAGVEFGILEAPEIAFRAGVSSCEASITSVGRASTIRSHSAVAVSKAVSASYLVSAHQPTVEKIKNRP